MMHLFAVLAGFLVISWLVKSIGGEAMRVALNILFALVVVFGLAVGVAWLCLFGR